MFGVVAWGLWGSSATPNSVILPHRSPDSGSFVMVSATRWVRLSVWIHVSATRWVRLALWIYVSATRWVRLALWIYVSVTYCGNILSFHIPRCFAYHFIFFAYCTNVGNRSFLTYKKSLIWAIRFCYNCN